MKKTLAIVQRNSKEKEVCNNNFLLWLPVPFVIIIPFIGHGWCLGLLFPFSVFIIVGIALWRYIFICISEKTCQKREISFSLRGKITLLLALHTLLFFGRYAIDIDDNLRLAPIFMMDIFLTPFYAVGKCIGLDGNIWSGLVFGFIGTIMWIIIVGLCLNTKK